MHSLFLLLLLLLLSFFFLLSRDEQNKNPFSFHYVINAHHQQMQKSNLFFYSFCFSVHSILKSIEFPHHHNDDGEDEDDDQVNNKQQQQQQKQQQPLEILLLERNKALQSENTALKVAHSELQGKNLTNILL